MLHNSLLLYFDVPRMIELDLWWALQFVLRTLGEAAEREVDCCRHMIVGVGCNVSYMTDGVTAIRDDNSI